MSCCGNVRINTFTGFNGPGEPTTYFAEQYKVYVWLEIIRNYFEEKYFEINQKILEIISMNNFRWNKSYIQNQPNASIWWVMGWGDDSVTIKWTMNEIKAIRNWHCLLSN